MKKQARRKQKSGRRRRKESRAHRLQQIEPNAAGIDVGAAVHYVAVPPDRDQEPVRHFGAMTSDLHALADWVQACGVTTVAMESTGVYWIPLYDLLEERGLEVCLVNAKYLQGVPGRKSDVLDCEWLQQLHTFGLLRRSFRPDHDFLKLRTYVRHRGTLIDERSTQVLRMQKALTICNVQLHLVVTDITGQTGMRIIRDIVAGNHDPQALAKHRDPRCKKSVEQIAEALRGEFHEQDLFVLRQALRMYDVCNEMLAECDQAIQHALDELARTQGAHVDSPPAPQPQPQPRPARAAKARRRTTVQSAVTERLHQLVAVDLTAVPGMGEMSALQLIAEIGIDTSRWPDPGHFSSWTTLAPSCRITGGRSKTTHRPASAHRVATILRMAAMSAGKTQTAIGAFYRRLAYRAGKGKAIVATAAKLARIIYCMIRDRTEFRDVGAAVDDQRQRQRVIRNLQRRAKQLGLTLLPAEQPIAHQQLAAEASQPGS